MAQSAIYWWVLEGNSISFYSQQSRPISKRLLGWVWWIHYGLILNDAIVGCDLAFQRASPNSWHTLVYGRVVCSAIGSVATTPAPR